MTHNRRFSGLFERGPGWGWIGGYLVASWGVLQVTETVASLIGLPLWFGKAVIALLAVGLGAVVLTALLQSGPAASDGASAARLRLRRLFTWRRTAAVGLAAFVLLGAGTAGHLGARALGVGPVGTLLARGVLTEDAELVLAAFEDHADDPAMARAATEALRVHLSQSPSLSLVTGSRVREALERMEADPAAPLDLATARDMAVREGLKAVVAGEIHRVGSGYTISARLVAAETGAELASGLETARDPDGVIEAVERLSIRLRERIGESLASIRRSPPLERVRTGSLAALKNYTEAAEANSRGEFERCVLLLNEAIALDSTFAMAYNARAGCNQNMGRDRARQIADRVRAHGLRDRMTEEERLRFTALYHHLVTEERRQAIEAWEAYRARYPDRPTAVFSLASLHAEIRDWATAERLLLEGLDLAPENLIVLINLAGFQTNQGRFDDARATFARLEEALPGLDLAWRKATLHMARAAWDSAAAELAIARERSRGNPGSRAIVANLQARLARTLGRAGDAERYLREAMAADLESGAIELYHLRAIELAELQMHERADTAAALALVEEVLAAYPLADLEPLERSYLALAEFYARAGRLDAARRAIADWEREVAPIIPGSTLPHRVTATLAEAEGRFAEAIAEWRLQDEGQEDPLPALVHAARLFDRSGRPDSAVVYYERYLETPSRVRYDTDPAWRGRVLERLGRLMDDRGECDRAASYYAALLDLWDDAEPPVLDLVDAARARLSDLVAEGHGPPGEPSRPPAEPAAPALP